MEFQAINITVDEPDQSPYRVNAVLTVQLSQAVQPDTSRSGTGPSTSHSTDAAERDYNAASGTLYFSPGTTERTIIVTVLNDTTVEESFERFRVELFQATNATLGSYDNAQVVIRDDDVSAPYNLTAPATVREDQGTFTVTVETASTFPW